MASLPLPEKIIEQFRYIAGVDSEVTAEEQAQIDAIEEQILPLRAALDGTGPDPDGTILGASIGYYRHLERQSPPDQAAALRVPILVMQGTRDYQVTMEDFDGWKEALSSGDNATFKVYPGLNHLFIEGKGKPGPAEYDRRGHVSEQVIDDIATWIRGHSSFSSTNAN